jgi:hypothetical protein
MSYYETNFQGLFVPAHGIVSIITGAVRRYEDIQNAQS